MSRLRRLCVMGIVPCVVFAATTAAWAKVTTYECTFDAAASSAGGYISNLVILAEEDGGPIAVYDGVIAEFVGEPIEAKRAKQGKVYVGEPVDPKRAQTKSVVRYSWAVRIVNAYDQKLRLMYVLEYSKGQAKLSARPAGYDNNWTADGECKVTEE